MTAKKSKRPRKWAAGKPRKIPKSTQALVIATTMEGHNKKETARITGLDRETVTRILSQEEYGELVQRYRSAIMARVPKILKGLDHLIKKKDRQAILDCLYGLKILAQHHELEVMPVKKERDYSSAIVEYHAVYGEWPTLEQAKEFDKNVKVELLTKKPTKPS